MRDGGRGEGGNEGEEGRRGGRTLIRHILSECVRCVGFRWTKPQFLAYFDIFGGSCTDLLLPMRARFCDLSKSSLLPSYPGVRERKRITFTKPLPGIQSLLNYRD